MLSHLRKKKIEALKMGEILCITGEGDEGDRRMAVGNDEKAVVINVVSPSALFREFCCMIYGSGLQDLRERKACSAEI